MAKKEKTFGEMSLEEVRQKLGHAISYINMYAKDRQTVEMVLNTKIQHDLEAKLFNAVKETVDTYRELSKRFNAPANYEE